MRRELRWCFLASLAAAAIGSVGASGSDPSTAGRFETVRTSNAAILNRLGLAPLQIPDGHHKKRLAGPEPPGLPRVPSRSHQVYSRRHGHRDSHVYIVKLPASPPYYTITKPHKSVKSEKPSSRTGTAPVGFQGNGKPAKVYHWNLPVVRRMGEKKRLHAQLRMDQARRKMEESRRPTESVERNTVDGEVARNEADDEKVLVERRRGEKPNVQQQQKYSTSSKHTRNNDKRLNYADDSTRSATSTRKSGQLLQVQDGKTYRLEDSSVHRIGLADELHVARQQPATRLKKHRKKAAMSYYAPINAGTTKIHKNFPGNGKPKAFYVMEKSRKPVYYHPLLP